MQKHTPTYDEALSLLKEFNKSESQLLEHLVQREPRLMDKIKFLQLDFGTWD